MFYILITEADLFASDPSDWPFTKDRSKAILFNTLTTHPDKWLTKKWYGQKVRVEYV